MSVNWVINIIEEKKHTKIGITINLLLNMKLFYVLKQRVYHSTLVNTRPREPAAPSTRGFDAVATNTKRAAVAELGRRGGGASITDGDSKEAGTLLGKI